MPDSSGKVEFEADLSHFSHLHVIALDKNVAAMVTHDLPTATISKRDLTLTRPLDSSKGFTESRITVNLQKFGTHVLEDVTSTEIQTIDDLTKVRRVIEELFKSSGNLTMVKKFKFLLDWPKLSFE